MFTVYTNIYSDAVSRIFSFWFSALPAITRGAVLTAALIVLIRLVFRKVLSAKAKYYLWLLLALRLVLPIVPASPTSLLNFLPTSGSQTQSAPEAPVFPSTPAAPEAVFTEYDPDAEVLNIADTAPTVMEAPAAPQAPAAPKIPIETILFWVWIAGVGVTLTVYGVLYLITAVQLKRLPVCTDSDTIRTFLQLKRVCGVKGHVRLASGGAGMLGGLFHSTIVLPVERHGEDATPILVHELLHFKHRDLRLSAIFHILKAVYWFNPVVWLCFHWAKLDCEAACDQRVLETGLVRPDSYAGALYEEGVLSMKPGILTAFGGNRHSLKRRIRHIAGFKSPKMWMTALAVILAVVVTACTMTGAAPKAAIRDAIVGAEEAEDLLFCGYYPSGELTTANLTEAEINAQVSAMDQLLRRYYSADSWVIAGVSGDEGVNPRITDYEYRLRNVWTKPENLSYVLDRRVLSCKLSRLQVDGDTAQTQAELVTYSNSIEMNEAGKFILRCGGGLSEDLTFYLVQEDGTWKVQGIDNPGGEAWMHPWSAELEQDTFDTFEQALAAAQSVDGISQCPYVKEPDPDLPHVSLIPDSATAAGTFDAYMETRQPPNGVFGLTLDEHVQQGLLTLEDGTVEQGASEQAPLTFTNFCTVSELGGKTVDIVYHFSQTALSDAEILTQVFVTPPEDVPIGTWLSSISDPWLSGLTQNTDLNGWEWKADKYVADFLTEEQTDAAVRALVALGEISTSPDAMKSESAAQAALCSGWRVVTAFYTGEANLWQFNGTGAALIMAAQKNDAEEAPDSSLEAASALDGMANTSTFSPYVLSGDSLTYENTAWDMTFSEVVSAQNLDMDTWKSSDAGQPTIYLDQPLSGRPEVARITYTFNVKNPAVLKTLSFVEVNYDPEKISYENLVSQRTQAFGQPDGVGDNHTGWVIGNIQLAIYSGKNELRERIQYYVDRSEELPPTPEQLEAFLADIQPPNGHYGWTFEQHVEAGLLNPEQGEVVEGSTSDIYHVFETEMELGGETVTIDYVFSETMATHDTGLQVLTEVHVDPPDKIPFSQWVARFSEPWSNRMVRMPDANQWNSFLTVGPLLTDTQREYIVQELLENGRVAETLDEAYQYLENWNMAMNFYEAARGWVFNGTGAALYLTAQNIQP